MVLRPILDLIDTLDVILKNDEFSWFSIFWIVGFDTSDRPYGVIRPNIGRLMLFSKKVHRNLFPNLAGRGLTQIRHLGSIFYEKTRKNGFYGMLCVEYSTAVEYSTGPEISTIEKFINSSTCYTLRFFHISRRSKVINVWNPKIIRFVGFLQIHHVH